MSSATSTDRSTFRPWQFFILAGLVAATAGLFLAQRTTRANLILGSVGIASASLAALALYRTLSPLTVERQETVELVGHRTRVALEREKMLVLRSIKELEFDRAMGKVAEPDFDEMVDRLRARAIALMRQLDAGSGAYRELIDQELRARLASKGLSGPAVRSGTNQRGSGLVGVPNRISAQPAGQTCEICETENDRDARFCKHCGLSLSDA